MAGYHRPGRYYHGGGCRGKSPGSWLYIFLSQAGCFNHKYTSQTWAKTNTHTISSTLLHILGPGAGVKNFAASVTPACRKRRLKGAGAGGRKPFPPCSFYFQKNSEKDCERPEGDLEPEIGESECAWMQPGMKEE